MPAAMGNLDSDDEFVYAMRICIVPRYSAYFWKMCKRFLRSQQGVEVRRGRTPDFVGVQPEWSIVEMRCGPHRQYLLLQPCTRDLCSPSSLEGVPLPWNVTDVSCMVVARLRVVSWHGVRDSLAMKARKTNDKMQPQTVESRGRFYLR
jgi:hypothetical protein